MFLNSGKSSSASLTFFKVVLYLSNILLLVGSVVTIVSLMMLMVNGKEYIDLMGNNSSWIIACAVLAVALFMFFISVLGCCGAAGKNICILKLYISIVSTLLVALVAGTLIAWLYKGDAFSTVEANMKLKMQDYSPGKRTDDTTRVWDDIQTHLQCCGINDVYDWTKYSESYRASDVNKYPESCKQKHSEEFGRGGRNVADVYVDGCLVKVEKYLEQHLWHIGGAIAAVFLYLLLSILVVSMLAKSISDLERKKTMPTGKEGLLVNEAGFR